MIQGWMGWASGPVSFLLLTSFADNSTLVGIGAEFDVGGNVDEGLFVIEADAEMELALVAVGNAVVNGTKADSMYSIIDMLVNTTYQERHLRAAFLRATKLCIGEG